jgi:hypothetical protein
MKNRFLIPAILLCLLANRSFAQPNMLEKYWFYKERLKNFVLATPNYTDAGTNIPADWINGEIISWDDGNMALNQYISVLATEYRLLKNNGIDYTQTIKDLYYALKSLERLDKTAEAYYRDDRSLPLESDLNGFFVRRDITPTFWNKYGSNGTYPYFRQSRADSVDLNRIPPEQSEDNCWHHLEALALVKALVGNETVNGSPVNFSQWAKDITCRIIGKLYHDHARSVNGLALCYPDNCYGICSNWYVENPVTGSLVEEGDGMDGTILYASYGFQQAAYNIAGVNPALLPINSYSEYFFRKLLALPVAPSEIKLFADNRFCVPLGNGYIDFELWSEGANFNVKVADFGPNCEPSFSIDSKTAKISTIDEEIDDYKLRSLCATGNISDQNGLDPYHILMNKQIQSQKYKYEHFPLIWSVINNDFSNINTGALVFIRSLLNTAPVCGPDKWLVNGAIQYDNINWSSTSRLVWPENCGIETHDLGEFNGLDFMLLHNLYWLASPVPAEYVTYFQDMSNMNYTDGAIAKNEITCYSEVNIEEFTVELAAGNRVRLNQGFKIIAGEGTFRADVSETGPFGEAIKYNKMGIDGYPCNPIIGVPKSAKEKPVSSESEPWFKYYPNPAKDYFVINAERIIKRIEVYNLSGSLLKKYEPMENKTTIDISSLCNGIYICRIFDTENNIGNFKIIAQ